MRGEKSGTHQSEIVRKGIDLVSEHGKPHSPARDAVPTAGKAQPVKIVRRKPGFWDKP